MTTNELISGRRDTAGPSRWARAAVAALLLAVGMAACSGTPSCDEQIEDVRPGVCLTDPDGRPAAPQQTGPVLGDADEQIGVGDLAGQVVVLNVWGSWCGPCRREQPELNDAHAALADRGVAFLGVDVGDSEPNGLAHVAEFDIPYPSIYDPSYAYTANYRGIGRQTVPSTIVIDREGRVAATLIGETVASELVALVSALLDQAT